VHNPALGSPQNRRGFQGQNDWQRAPLLAARGQIQRRSGAALIRLTRSQALITPPFLPAEMVPLQGM
jgi:hypothetical protein